MLALNSLRSTFDYLCNQSTGIKDMCYHCLAKIFFLRERSKIRETAFVNTWEESQVEYEGWVSGVGVHAASLNQQWPIGSKEQWEETKRASTSSYKAERKKREWVKIQIDILSWKTRNLSILIFSRHGSCKCMWKQNIFFCRIYIKLLDHMP